MIGTYRSRSVEVAGADNVVFGVDTGLSFYDSLTLTGYYARANTPGLEGNDHSYRARFDYEADLLAVKVEHLGVGANFNPEVGFLRRRDFVETIGQLRVSRRPASMPSVRRVNLELGLDYITDNERVLENRLFQAALRTEMQSGDSWSVRYERHYEFVPQAFRLPGDLVVPVGVYSHPFGVAVYTLGSQRKVSGEVSAGYGGFYDGSRTDLSYRGRVELMPQLSLEPGLAFNWMDLSQGETRATLGSVRATYSFSTRCGLRPSSSTTRRSRSSARTFVSSGSSAPAATSSSSTATGATRRTVSGRDCRTGASRSRRRGCSGCGEDQAKGAAARS